MKRHNSQFLMMINLLLCVFIGLAGTQAYAASTGITEVKGLPEPLSENTGGYIVQDPNVRTDPLEIYNRTMFRINTEIDRFVIEPIAVVYKTVVPQLLRSRVTNFFGNFGEVPTIINGVLQGKLLQALSDVWRLAINSTIGIGGLFDVASHIGLEKHYEDMGLTLARWGYKKSAYFVLPILGPSTIRDGLGLPVNTLVFSVWPYIPQPIVTYSLLGLSVVNNRANLLQADDVLDVSAIDPYIVVRDAYLERRAHQMGRGTDHNDDDLYVEDDAKQTADDDSNDSKSVKKSASASQQDKTS